MSIERSPQIPENILYYTETEGRKNAAFIFQGQGTQEVGMGRDLCSAYPEVAQLYAKASHFLRRVLNPDTTNTQRSLLDLTEEELKRTDFAQLAIFVHSEACRIAFIKQREERGEEPMKPKFYAGNSLGELNAFYAARAFENLEDALYVVLTRGREMQKACEKNSGGLMVFSGSKEILEGIIKRLTGKKESKLYLEAMNSETQIVLSGINENLETAWNLINDAFGSNIKTIKLNVAGAFHSPLMGPAIPRFKEVVKRLRRLKRIKKLEVPVIANTTGRPIKYPLQIERELVDHLTKPVLWKQTVDFLEEQGVVAMVEVGKKTVLTNMMRNRGKIAAGVGLGLIGAAALLYFRRRPENK